MESDQGKVTSEERAFRLDLNSSPQAVKDKFYHIKAGEANRIAVETGTPASFSLDDLESILTEAKRAVELDKTAKEFGIGDVKKWQKKNDGRTVYRGGED